MCRDQIAQFLVVNRMVQYTRASISRSMPLDNPASPFVDLELPVPTWSATIGKLSGYHMRHVEPFSRANGVVYTDQRADHAQ